LSGGERQRVAIARSMAIAPEVLLLDEVLNTLDEKLRKEMQIELRRFQHELKKTFIFVTHSQEEALTMSDRVGVMNFGVLEQVGTPLELYQHPKNHFVADFIGMSNLFAGAIVATDDRRVTVDWNGLRFHPRSAGTSGTPRSSTASDPCRPRRPMPSSEGTGARPCESRPPGGSSRPPRRPDATPTTLAPTVLERGRARSRPAPAAPRGSPSRPTSHGRIGGPARRPGVSVRDSPRGMRRGPPARGRRLRPRAAPG